MTTTPDAEPTYLFGPRDRRTLLLGMRLPQLILVAAGALSVLVGLLSQAPYGVPAGVTGCVAAAVTAFMPVQGRVLVDWARPVANFVHGRITGQGTYLGGPAAVHVPSMGKQLALPGIGSSLRVRSVDSGRGDVAVLRQNHRWTAILQVTAPAYPLADRATQQERVAAWGSLLAQLGQEGSRLAAVQWLERTIPDSGRGLDDWWRLRGAKSAVNAQHYESLIADAGPAATRHETFVAVSIDQRRCRRAIRSAGGGPEGTSKVLMNELSWVESGLRRSDVEVVGWLGVNDLGKLVRTQYDPSSGVRIDDRSRSGGLGHGMALQAAGPMAARSSFSHYRTDTGFHAVYWIASWPRMQVQAAWLYPLLVLGGVRRTVSVTAEPVAPSQSFREVRSAKVQKVTEESQRERFGQIETALDDEEHAAVLRRERELVQGHVEYRFTGFVTVTAETEAALEEACGQIEQAAVRSVLEIRRVLGEQDQAFIAGALPLARGVR